MEGFENRGGEIRRTWYINGTYQDSVQDHKGGPPVRDTGKFVEVCFKPRYSEGQNGDWRPRLPRPGNDACEGSNSKAMADSKPWGSITPGPSHPAHENRRRNLVGEIERQINRWKTRGPSRLNYENEYNSEYWV